MSSKFSNNITQLWQTFLNDLIDPRTTRKQNLSKNWYREREFLSDFGIFAELLIVTNFVLTYLPM